MTCKDCYHFDACVDKLGTTKFYDNVIAENNVEELCPQFKDKSLILELPCKVGDTVYMPSRASFPKGVVSAIHINEQRSHIMIDLDFHFRAKHYLDEYGIKWFTSQEEAESALKELKDDS